MCSDAEFSAFALANANAYILDKFPSDNRDVLCRSPSFCEAKKRNFFWFEGIKKREREKRERERKRGKEEKERQKKKKTPRR